MSQEYRITYMPENEWKLPFNIAIGFHILVILGIFYLPGLFDTKPKFADIYTVSLITVAEPVREKTVVPPPVKKVVKTKKVISVAKQNETVSPLPKKAISLKPLKRKKIKKITPKIKPSRTESLNRQKRQKLAAALRAEELAEENARLAKEELERELNLMKPSAPTQVNKTRLKTGQNVQKQAGGSTNFIEGQYHAAIFGRLHQFWSLPEYMQKNSDLTAVVVITIKSNGEIANMFFENKSGNRVFDQFVEKTLKAASPLPPIPAAMKKQHYEIGLRFKPGSIQ